MLPSDSACVITCAWQPALTAPCGPRRTGLHPINWGGPEQRRSSRRLHGPWRRQAKGKTGQWRHKTQQEIEVSRRRRLWCRPTVQGGPGLGKRFGERRPRPTDAAEPARRPRLLAPVQQSNGSGSASAGELLPRWSETRTEAAAPARSPGPGASHSDPQLGLVPSRTASSSWRRELDWSNLRRTLLGHAVWNAGLEPVKPCSP